MTDTTELRGKIEDKGLKLRFIAEQLGLTPYGLTLKIDGKNEFKASEIKKMSDILSLSSGDVYRIFFAERVD